MSSCWGRFNFNFFFITGFLSSLNPILNIENARDRIILHFTRRKNVFFIFFLRTFCTTLLSESTPKKKKKFCVLLLLRIKFFSLFLVFINKTLTNTFLTVIFDNKFHLNQLKFSFYFQYFLQKRRPPFVYKN